MAPRLLLIAVLVACLHGSGARRFEPKGASVTLHAKWLGTPLLHEAAEFLVRGAGGDCAKLFVVWLRLPEGAPWPALAACRLNRPRPRSEASGPHNSFADTSLHNASPSSPARRMRTRLCSGGLWRGGVQRGRRRRARAGSGCPPLPAASSRPRSPRCAGQGMLACVLTIAVLCVLHKALLYTQLEVCQCDGCLLLENCRCSASRWQRASTRRAWRPCASSLRPARSLRLAPAAGRW